MMMIPTLPGVARPEAEIEQTNVRSMGFVAVGFASHFVPRSLCAMGDSNMSNGVRMMIGAGIVASAFGLAFGARRLQSMSSTTEAVVKSVKTMRGPRATEAAKAATMASNASHEAKVKAAKSSRDPHMDNALRQALRSVQKGKNEATGSFSGSRGGSETN